MSSERYLNHPTFGMLYQVSPGNEGKDIYATLYAQKMFFLVEIKQRDVFFEVIPYLDARNPVSYTHLTLPTTPYV